MQSPVSPTLSGVLAAIRRVGVAETVSVQDILHEIGDRSFATVLLVPALILVTPLSGIPGAPTFGAIVVILIVSQWIARRDHLWLPGFVTRRRVASDRMRKALDWLERPAALIDRITAPRLTWLATGPLAVLPLLTVLCIAASWPLLEILPFVTTTGAVAVSLFAFGLMTRDGLFVLAGYGFVGAVAALLARVI